MIYTSIDFLPIYNYIKCSEGDLKYLYSDYQGKIDSKLVDTFETIQEEFSDRMNDKTMKLTREKLYRIIKLNIKCERLQNYLILLAIKEDEDVIKWLKDEGFKYDSKDRLSSLKTLQGEITNLRNKILEIEMTIEKTTDVKLDIFDVIAQIEKARGIAIDPHKLTTAQFISYIKDLKHGK